MLLSEEGGKILRDSLHEVDFTSKDLKQILRNNIHYNVITNQVENSTLQAVISSLKGTETLDIGGKNISSIKNTLIEAFSSVSNELENDMINLSKLVKQEINENLESPLNKKNLICFNNRLCSINNVMENNNEYPFMNMNRISPQELFSTSPIKISNAKNLNTFSPFNNSSFSLGQSPNIKSFVNYSYLPRKDSNVENYQKFFTAYYETDNSRSLSNTNLLNMSTKSNSLATNKHSPFSKNINDSDNKKLNYHSHRKTSSSCENMVIQNVTKEKNSNLSFGKSMKASNNNNVISNFSTKRSTRQAAINANTLLKNKRKSSNDTVNKNNQYSLINNNNVCELSREFSFKNEVTNLSGSDKNCNSRLLLQDIIKQDVNSRISRHTKQNLDSTGKKSNLNNLPLGLKEISNKVKKIIKDRRTTSYKEISDNIVQELDVISSQDSKNIRRRIYDALNVIKALGLFTNNPQDSKSIVWNSDVNQAEVNEDIKQKITEEEKIIAAKNEICEEIRVKIAIYQSLISKNKSRDLLVEESEKIKPPFLVLSSATSLLDHINLVFEESQKKMHISSSYPMNIKGDLDIITSFFSS